MTVEYALVLDSKGIRQAVEEKNPLKALNSFAIRDIIDGVDSPLIVFEATVTAAVEVSAAIVKIGASGGITVRVEIDLYDPFPETSGESPLRNDVCMRLVSFISCLLLSFIPLIRWAGPSV